MIEVVRCFKHRPRSPYIPDDDGLITANIPSDEAAGEPPRRHKALIEGGLDNECMTARVRIDRQLIDWAAVVEA